MWSLPITPRSPRTSPELGPHAASRQRQFERGPRRGSRWPVVTRANQTAEWGRLRENYHGGVPWLRWGPYLSERQWGTVREDYSESGDAWGSFSHDQARSRAYRWGEDGLAGISDDKQRLCFALAVWNERDPILKERLF